MNLEIPGQKDRVLGTDGGEVHWQNVRKELKEINFSGWATAEVKGGNEARLKRAAKWMHGVLGLG